VDFSWTFNELPKGKSLLLAHGQGRSYGDACLNNSGTLISTRHLNRLIGFDDETGIIKCESGVTLAEILRFAVPRGWFIPVSPGTKFVSVGGAIANDIHGKNHHVAGTFGRNLLSFELLRSDGHRTTCSPKRNDALFNATIAGLGLTGFITWAEIQLKKIKGPFIDEESIKFSSLDKFFELSRSSDSKSEYTVAWLDCIGTGSNFGRGIFMRGNHSENTGSQKDSYREGKLSVPIDFPSWALNSFTVKAFNALYYNKQLKKTVTKTIHYDPFFYPLDSVHGWNKIYGKNGFLQFQCVIPTKDSAGQKAIEAILREVVAAQSASFLAVLKEFGDIESPGLMSFPRQGITLCLDFAFRGDETLRLFRKLHKIVFDNGGAIYPAKDACMTPEEFSAAFPKLKEFTPHIDKAFSSDFWRRVTKGSTND